MKHVFLLFVLCLTFIAAQSSVAQLNGLGIGIIIGEPTGISTKVWTSHKTAFDIGLGWSMHGDRMNNLYYNGTTRVHIHVDYLWHSFEAIHSSERYPLYYGLGGRINDGAGNDLSLAVRGVLGIAWLPRETPIDIFLEFVPMIQLTSSVSSGLEAAIGARYYF